MRPFSRRKGRAFDDDALDLNALKLNCLRIKAALTREPSWWELVVLMREWKDPFLSCFALVLVVSVGLYAQLWQLPGLLSGLVIALSLYSGSARGRRRAAEVSTWHRESESTPRKSIVGKAVEGKAFVLKAQRGSAKIASVLERARNSLNWSDRNISLLFCAVIGLTGALSSILMLFVQVVCAYIPLRYMITNGMVLFLMPKRVRKQLHPRNLPLLWAIIQDVKLAIGLSSRTVELEKNSPEDEVDLSYVNIFPEDVMGQAGFDFGGENGESEDNLKDLGKFILGMTRLFNVVPDEAMATHKVIADRQLRYGATGSRMEPYQVSEGPSGADFETINPTRPVKPLVLKSKPQGDTDAAIHDLEREVLQELREQSGDELRSQAWDMDKEALVMKEELEQAMSMPTQALIFELRKAGVETKGLAEKAELASELAQFRTQNRKALSTRGEGAAGPGHGEGGRSQESRNSGSETQLPSTCELLSTLDSKRSQALRPIDPMVLWVQHQPPQHPNC